MKFDLSKDGWFDLLRTGEFPNETTLPDKTKRFVLQVITPQDLADLMAVWEEMNRPELLIDREHQSHEDAGSSEAMGWLKGLRLTPDGEKLQATARWSETGRQLLEGGAYRYCSASLGTQRIPGGEEGTDPAAPAKVQPIVLRRIGLTNLPAVDGLLPISNSLPGGGLGPSPAEKTATPNQPDNTKKKMDLKQLALALGLPETATMEEILLAAAALKKANEEHTKAMGEEADATMEEYKNCIPEGSRALMREMLVSNRKATLTVLEGLKKPEAAGEIRVHNRQAAAVKGAPEGVKDAPKDGPSDRRAAQEAAVLEVMNRANYSGKGRTAAFEIASREKPELFAPQV